MSHTRAGGGHVLKAIGLKLLSALLFAVMSTFVRLMRDSVPVGQMMFFRSLFAILPVVVIYAWRRELRKAIHTSRPLGQLGRGVLSGAGMFSNFFALTRLPLADATAISFASPLITVALAALVLKERVRVYRWSAVGVGFIGVIVMLLPHLDIGRYAGVATAAASTGAMFALASAFCNAGTVVQTRRLTRTETTPSIVFYFSLICAILAGLTLPFAWHMPNGIELTMLVATGILGGVAHIFLTESYRHAAASVVAPFDYTAMLWALALGFWIFGEVPTTLVFIGGGIVAAAGLFVIWRERQLGLQRALEAEGLKAPT